MSLLSAIRRPIYPRFPYPPQRQAAMIGISPEILAVGFLLAIFIGVLTGYHVALVLIGVGFVITSTALHPVINKTISETFPYLFTFLALTLLYVLVPNCKVKIRNATPGAIIATVLFELTKRGFAFYIASFPAYTLIYGALAAVPIFLLWLYLSWLIILFGASVSHTLQQ